MKQLKAIIFDVDGTLSETERDGHRVAFNRAFSEAGLDWFWDEALYGQLLAVTGGKERIRYYLSEFNQTYQPTENLDDLIVKLHALKTKHYVNLLETHAIGLRPGVERLIREIHESDLRLAIATTTTPENVTALLSSTLGVESVSWFDSIAAGDIVPAKKPAPDIFEYCLNELGLLPEECLVFEDSENGLKASTGAHLATVVTINDYTKNDDLSGALAVFDQIGEENNPCTQIAGKAITSHYISIDDLYKLHAND
jgi:HAD superfamily hydrolase (TIGR01509 family)